MPAAQAAKRCQKVRMKIMFMEKKNDVEVNDISMQDFTKAISECKGDVYMVTAEGDRLNLKSKLCQMLGFTSLIKGGQIASAQFECTDPEDESRLFRFNLFGEK